MSANELFDTYSIRARQLPALLLVLPVVFVAALLFPSLYATASNLIGSLGISALLLLLVAHILRQRGRELQGKLYREWDGPPTTRWLRHSDRELEASTKSRYHTFLTARIPNLVLPSAEDETRDRIGSDEKYASGIKWLLEATRDTLKFPLVFQENVSYGFRRNLLAAKPLALAMLFGLMIITAVVTYSRFENIDANISLAWLTIVVFALFWMFIARPVWVKDASESYARALLAACENV